MNGRPVVYYQTDPRWAGSDYSAPGERTDIRESGCGPTAAAMVAATWADKAEDPTKACAWSLAHGYKAPHQGTYYAFFAPYLARFGIGCRQLNGARIDQAGAAYGKPYHDAVRKALAGGALVIACMGPGTWTRSGHFVLLYGVEGGVAYINDPASSAPQRIRGDWAVFQRQVKYYFVCTRPKAPQKEEEMTQEQFDAMLDNCLARRAKADGSAWSRADRDWAVAHKLVQGDGAGNLGWQAHLTLEGAVALLHRLWALMRGSPMAEREELCAPCPLSGRVEALERGADAERQARSRTHEKIYDRLRELERTVSVVSTQYAQIISQLSALSADIAALKDKPAKRWDTVIAAAVSALVGFAFARLGAQ